MATWDDVRRIALALPGTSEVVSRGNAQWRVKDRNFVWDRPLRRTDVEALGDRAPQGPIVAARVPDLGVRQALISGDPKVYFTIPHFDGFPAVLVLLDRIGTAELRELIVEAWLDRAPKRLAAEYRDQPPE
ncbi:MULTISPECIES: MmcQ/YjbR family DNA-binding protein [Streptacidiphilus]|uniref:MmcQ/YjbR family DNA-binding protein n=1 Tax=Streptacidiphilus cavernicola TaxID=3342716 RepID=A0ABV6UY97_9ACTN|nr:MmcQ/YjbR family DNA-binding protein [Streptacidiphilus jeojiense]